MVLPAPDLDDRRFQQLVDDAKRLVQQRCPEWTDHNVSDPGVTLIEAFAQMVDQLIYRLNRVPDRHYMKFLELIGVELLPPAAAQGQATFWLSAPQPQPVRVRAETEVATARTDIASPIVFTTLSDLEIVPCSLAYASAMHAGQEPVDHTVALQLGDGFSCFSPIPAADDALLVGLSGPVPSCAIVIRVDCPVKGVGIDPTAPPLMWEAWTGSGWLPCDVDHDDTGGFNMPGDVVLHVPADHQASVLARRRAGWLRCRVLPSDPLRPDYTESPRILKLAAFTIGGTTATVHAEVIRDEVIGVAAGTPGERFQLQRRSIVFSDEPMTLRVTTGPTSAQWQLVEHFAASGPDDQHFRIDTMSGEVQLGPAVREADGTLRHYGAVPPKGATLQLSTYRTGGGKRGNVGRGQVRLLKTSVPYVSRVENRSPSIGGADGESVDNAKLRGPVLLRTRGRAVTAEDFEQLALQVAPEAARVRCVTSTDAGDAGGVRLLVVPHVASDDLGRVQRDDLRPTESMLTRITTHLDERRLVGTRLLVAGAEYQGLTAVVSVKADRRYQPAEVRRSVLRALYRLFHPLHGGPDGTGWPFGRAVQLHEVHAALASIAGVDMSEEVTVQIFPADERGARGAPVPRLELSPNALVYSFEHQVRVQP